MQVHDCQGITNGFVRQPEPALVIHGPDMVGMVGDGQLPWPLAETGVAFSFLPRQPFLFQDDGNGAGRGGLEAPGPEFSGDLAGTLAGIRFALSDNGLAPFDGCLMRTPTRSTAQRTKSVRCVFGISSVICTPSSG